MKKKIHPIKFCGITDLAVHHYEEEGLCVTKIRIDTKTGDCILIELETIGEPRFLSFIRKEIKIKYEGGHNDETERIRKKVASFKIEDQSDEDTKVIKED